MTDTDRKCIEIRGNMYWMPQLETIELIKEFLDDLHITNKIGSYHRPVNDKLGELIKKWKNKLNPKLKYKAEVKK